MGAHTQFVVGLCVLVAIEFVGVIALVVWLAPRLGGWRRLAKTYCARDQANGTQALTHVWRFQHIATSGRVTTNYGGCTRIGVDSEGLGLSLIWPLSLSHPPLFIPWADITVKPETVLGVFHRVRLTFAEQPGVAIYFGKPLAKKVQAAIVENWFAESGEQVSAG